MAEQQERTPSLSMGEGGSSGPYQETPEEVAAWAKLVRRFEKNGGEGITLDLRVRWTKLKYPHKVMRYNANTKKREVYAENGCMVVMRTTGEKGIEGLFFFKDGKYSLAPSAFLTKMVIAAARGSIKDGQETVPSDYVGAEVLLPVTMKTAARDKDGNPSTSRGGHYWQVGDPKPIPLLDDDDDDEAAAPVQSVSTAAPHPITGRAAPDSPDDDDEVPF